MSNKFNKDRMNIFNAILIYNSICLLISALKMKCSYENRTWKTEDGEVLGFVGTVIEKFEVKQRGLKIDKVIRDDPLNYPQPENYGDSSKFAVNSQEIWYFPEGLEIYFGGALILNMVNCNLREIKQQDLKVFPKLKMLSFDMNKIDALEKDLFKYNLDLTALKFNTNRIKFIDANLFDHLHKLTLVFFSDNDCTNYIAYNRTYVLKLMRDTIKNYCQNYGNFEEKEKVTITGTQRGKYFWIWVGCGVVVGAFLAFVVAKIIYEIVMKIFNKDQLNIV